MGPPRLCLSRREAAASLGVGLTFFEENIQPELEIVRRKTRVLIPVAALETWVRDNASKTLGASS